jgi:predicted chitinase
MTTLTELIAISKDKDTPLKELTKAQIAELQTALVKLGYLADSIDGLYGHNTRNAWVKFMDDADIDHEGDSINTGSIGKLQQMLNDTIGSRCYDFSTKTGTIEAIKSECIRHGIGLKTQIAYVLATADHETNHTFRPVTEAYWLDDPDAYLKKYHADYYPYYGRGYVQLTWDYNYEKFGKLVSKDLLAYPELALEPEVALFVLVHGFKTGAFSGRKISDYINGQATDFVKARYCINGQDKAHEIAELAHHYLAATI